MNTKKLIAAIFVSVCIFNSAKSMEFIGDVAKHEVIPAALIAGTCAVVGAATHCLNNKIAGVDDWKEAMKQGAYNGVCWSIPIMGAALIGPRSSRLDFSIKNSAILAGVAAVPYCCDGIYTWMKRSEHKQNMETRYTQMVTSNAPSGNITRRDKVYNEAYRTAIKIPSGMCSCASLFVIASLIGMRLHNHFSEL